MRSRHYLLIIMCSVLALGCKKDKSADKGAEEQAKTVEPAAEEAKPAMTEEAPKPEVEEVELPPMATLLTHQVENFDTWRSVFEGHQGARQEAGILGHILFQDAENPNLVTIYFPISDEAKFDAFVASDDLKTKMAEAGVKGPPTAEKMVPVSATPMEKAEGAGMFVEHEVADFDAWKKGYDEAGPIRATSGIYADAVFRSQENPNMVWVYHEAADLDALKAFMAKPELKEAMEKSGVKGDPKVHYLTKMSAYTTY